MAYKDFSPDIFYNLDYSKIIIKLNDLKYIPELQKYISINKIIKDGYVYLIDSSKNDQINIIELFLLKYDFIQYIGSDKVFNFNKLKKFWKNNVNIDNIILYKTPKYSMNINDENYDFYLWSDFKDSDILNIGLYFFSAYSMIEKTTEFMTINYDFFTDVSLDLNDFGMIKDYKTFFIQEFSVFINSNYGDVFGDYNFGSNIKNLIQSKYQESDMQKTKTDIIGFVNDLTILYNKAIVLKYVNIDYNEKEYNLIITVDMIINEENVSFKFIKNF